MEIQHFSHYHPLTLVHNDVDRDDHRCEICIEKLERVLIITDAKSVVHTIYINLVLSFPVNCSTPHIPNIVLILDLSLEEECANCCSDRFKFKYKCSDHCEFYLCPECAFLPLIKTVDIHDHPLILMRKPLPFMCDGCKKEDIGMFYFCSTCLFAVYSNSKCTSLPLIIPPTSTIQAAIHSHPLTLERKLLSFTCDACGNGGNGTFYFCATCSFVAHQDCAFLPSVVQVIRHKHPLNLIYPLPANHSKRRVCQLCAKTVDTNYWLYYCCSSHDFVAHLHCATSKEDRDETFVSNSKDEESIQSLSITNELEIDKMCNACIRSIFPPFYACAQCGFFLHKSCAEVPKTLRHSIHQQPLKLTYQLFVCDTCGRRCGAFDYQCDKCNFDIDVHCSSIPDIFTHPSHEHELILDRSSEAKKCSGIVGKLLKIYGYSWNYPTDTTTTKNALKIHAKH
ncbi:uncharacterized protein LOC121242370 [Juglans microcarpa x Juglans regia]|uniref:uncharacterized protein LOC121242370 n=1 Tax=Juglans microcarpa x Juglans regia TaxID=2249226 RepID=UPI001B7E9C0B|nr:uncharacterized protein LOC121242370 [Juglans microcarpa x Juglans regia]